MDKLGNKWGTIQTEVTPDDFIVDTIKISYVGRGKDSHRGCIQGVVDIRIVADDIDDNQYL